MYCIGSFAFKNKNPMIERFKIYILFFFIALGITFFVTKERYILNVDQKLERHTHVLNHTAENLYNYRIFPTICIEQIKQVTNLCTDNQKNSFLFAVCIFSFITYWLTLLSMYSFFRSIDLEELKSIISVLLWVVILPFSITGWDEIGDILNLCFFAFAFTAMLRGNLVNAALTIALASLNKEQAILIPIFYFVGFFDNKANIVNHLSRTFLLLSVFILTTLLLHVWVGQHPHSTFESSFFGTDYLYNLNNPEWVIVWILSLGVFIPFALQQLKDKHPFLRNNALITLPLFYIIIFFLRARMREIDKAFILHLILIPMAVQTLFPTRRKAS